MQDIFIEGTRDEEIIPSVHFNTKTGVCTIAGESFLEDTLRFYSPLIQWVKDFTEVVRKPITFTCKLTYFNTSTSKSLHEILRLLKTYEENGGQITVEWFYDEGDEEILEEIEDYIIDLNLDINLIPF